MADGGDEEPQGWSRGVGRQSGAGRKTGERSAGMRRWLPSAAGAVLLLAGGLGWWAAPTDGAMVGAPAAAPADAPPPEAVLEPQSGQVVAALPAGGRSAEEGMGPAGRVRYPSPAGASATVLPGGEVSKEARISSRARQLLSDEEREARRFRRQDRDKDGTVSRAEFLASRQKSFERLDKNGDGQLSFAEYAAATAARFEAADRNDDQRLNRTEFAATATPRSSGSRNAGTAAADGTARAVRNSS